MKNLQLASQLSDELLSVLAEEIGDSVRVRGVTSAETGLVAYGFPVERAYATVQVVPGTAEVALIQGEVLLGRVVPEYRRALRWLGCNRARNTVSLSLSEEAHAQKELRVGYARLTSLHDPFTIGQQINDLVYEVTRTTEILCSWFPQFMAGAWLMDRLDEMDDAGQASFHHGTMFPSQTLEILEREGNSVLGCCRMALAAANWTKLSHFARLLETEGDPDDPEVLVRSLDLQLVAFYKSGRLEEALEMAERVGEAMDEDPPSQLFSAKAACLVRLDRFTEAWEVCETAPEPDTPRVVFWRACAAMGLGDTVQAGEVFARYRDLVGVDILAEQTMADLEEKAGS